MLLIDRYTNFIVIYQRIVDTTNSCASLQCRCCACFISLPAGERLKSLFRAELSRRNNSFWIITASVVVAIFPRTPFLGVLSIRQRRASLTAAPSATRERDLCARRRLLCCRREQFALHAAAAALVGSIS